MIIEELTNIYENKMPKVAIQLPHEEALQYFERLLMQGNIITYIVGGELKGFLEFWRIDYSQMGRLLCGITLAHDEDLLNGNVALISRMWIDPEDRNGEAFLMLASMFLSRNKDASHFAAFQEHKKHKPFQVYQREDILKHYK